MDSNPLSEAQKQALDDDLKVAGAFESIAQTEGFNYIKAYYQEKLAQFMNRTMNETDKSISEFEGARQELIGLKNLLTYIDGKLMVLENFRKAQSEQSR